MANQAIGDAAINFKVKADGALSSIKKLQDKLGDLKSGIVGDMVSLGGAYFGMQAIRGAYDSAQKMVNLADQWKLPVEQVSQFSNLMAQFGGSTDDALNSVGSLQQAITDLRTTGSGALINLGAQIGLNPFKGMNGQVKNSLELMSDLRTRMKALPSDVQVKVLQEAGMNSPAMLRMMRASDSEYASMLEKAKSMNVIDADRAQKLRDMQMTIERLKNSFQSVMIALAPALDVVTGMMNWFSRQSGVVKFALIGAVAAVTILPPILRSAASVAGMIAKGFSLAAGESAIVARNARIISATGGKGFGGGIGLKSAGKMAGAAGIIGTVGALAFNVAAEPLMKAAGVGEKTQESVMSYGNAAIGGATVGAMIGSIIPGIGTAIGGAIGAGVGLLGTAITRNWDDIVGNTKQIPSVAGAGGYNATNDNRNITNNNNYTINVADGTDFESKFNAIQTRNNAQSATAMM